MLTYWSSFITCFLGRFSPAREFWSFRRQDLSLQAPIALPHHPVKWLSQIYILAFIQVSAMSEYKAERHESLCYGASKLCAMISPQNISHVEGFYLCSTGNRRTWSSQNVLGDKNTLHEGTEHLPGAQGFAKILKLYHRRQVAIVTYRGHECGEPCAFGSKCNYGFSRKIVETGWKQRDRQGQNLVCWVKPSLVEATCRIFFIVAMHPRLCSMEEKETLNTLITRGYTSIQMRWYAISPQKNYLGFIWAIFQVITTGIKTMDESNGEVTVATSFQIQLQLSLSIWSWPYMKQAAETTSPNRLDGINVEVIVTIPVQIELRLSLLIWSWLCMKQAARTLSQNRSIS